MNSRILVVEDNPGDVNLLRLALSAADVICDLTVIRDGQQALAYVRGHSGADDGRCPHDLAILDLNIPKNDGLEILEAMRASTAFAALPVVILTSSSSHRETARLKELSISRHIIKPLELDEFLKIGSTIRQIIAGRGAVAD